MKTFFLIMVLVSSSAHALNRELYLRADWVSLEADAVQHGRTPEEVSRRLQLIESLKAKRELCDLQLKARMVPFSCFDLLALESQSHVLTKKDLDFGRRHIDEVCLREVSRRDDLLLESNPALLPNTSTCREAYEKKIERLRYGAAFRDREGVFEFRHRF